jgi:hypothetical protein
MAPCGWLDERIFGEPRVGGPTQLHVQGLIERPSRIGKYPPMIFQSLNHLVREKGSDASHIMRKSAEEYDTYLV